MHFLRHPIHRGS